MVRARTFIAVAMLSLAATPATAAAGNQAEINAMLRADDRIWNGLLTASVIRHIVRNCDALEGPSRLARNAYFLPLYNRARSLGASRAQIEAFVEDEAERERMEEATERYIRQTGARPGDQASICALGRAEMAAGSPIGRRLSER